MTQLQGLLWLLLALGPLMLFQRLLHREIQAVLLLITRRADISTVLFSLLFFPGVLLHELSHFLMARLLWVRTGRFSIVPQPLTDGRLQLGYVETARTDLLRDALIGAAPLLVGGAFVAYAGLDRLGLLVLWESLRQAAPTGLTGAWTAVYQRSDFWLWVYLAFTVSSTMFPSRSDRRAWLPLSLAAALLLGLAMFAGAGPWMLQNLAPYVDRGLRAAAAVCSVSLGLHLLLWVPFAFTHRALVRITGLEAA